MKELVESKNNDLIESEHEIASNNEIKEIVHKAYEELEENRQECLDMYFIFKDMIVNSGDFDSSGVVKEQVVQLLKTAQDASNSKTKIALELLKNKVKAQTTIQNSEINQNNFHIQGMTRRSMIEAIEQIAHDEDFKKTVQNDIEIETEVDKLEEKEEESVNNDNQFSIESGEF